jgi:hypothetical protein
MKSWLIIWNTLCSPLMFWFWLEQGHNGVEGPALYITCALMTVVSAFFVSAIGAMIFHGAAWLNPWKRSSQSREHPPQG